MKNKLFKTLMTLGLSLSFVMPTMAATNITIVNTEIGNSNSSAVSDTKDYSDFNSILNGFKLNRGDYVSTQTYATISDLAEAHSDLMAKYNLSEITYWYTKMDDGYHMLLKDDLLEEYNTEYNQIQDWIENNIQNIVPNGTDRNSALMLINTWLCNHCTYELNHPTSDKIMTAFTTGRVSCEGYTNAFNAMVKYLPLENGVVNYGAANPTHLDVRLISDDAHAWSAVNLDGTWYYFDITFNDGMGDVNFDFMETADEFYGHLFDTNSGAYLRSINADPFTN